MSNHSKSAKARHPSRIEKRHSGALRSVDSPVKELMAKIRLSEEEKETIKRLTLGLYTLKVGDSPYGVPYTALSDSLALLAAKQLLPQANLYKVGTICLHNGKCTGLSKPVLVLDNKVDNKDN